MSTVEGVAKRDAMMAGRADKDYLVQQFAAHRVAALEEAAAIFEAAISEGYPEPPSKRDKCEHDRFGWEDCISCYDAMLGAAVARIRSLAPSSPLPIINPRQLGVDAEGGVDGGPTEQEEIR